VGEKRKEKKRKEKKRKEKTTQEEAKTKLYSINIWYHSVLGLLPSCFTSINP